MSQNREFKDKSSILAMGDFPTNSNAAKQEKANTPKKVSKVVSGTVKRQKQTVGKKVMGTLINDDEDTPNVMSYIMYDVLIPAAKTTISEMVSGGVEMLLFGSTKGSRTTRDRGRSYVSYKDVSNSRAPRSRELSYANRARHNFDDIILETRGEAEEVLSHLVDLVDIYGAATVADLYDLVEVTSNFTDAKYGWTNLSRATVSRVRGGYLISLPKTQVVD